MSIPSATMTRETATIMPPNPTNPLSFRLAYASGTLTFVVKDVAFGAFVLFYYTSIQGVSGNLAGAVLLIAMTWDAITDPIVGSISDNLRTRWGRRHPMMVLGALPMAICMYLLFAVPEGLTEWQTLAWMLIVCVLLRTFFTLFSVPYLALGAELSEDYVERTAITGLRTVVHWLGAILLTSAAWGFVFQGEGELDGRLIESNYHQFGMIALVLVVLFAATATGGTSSRIQQLPIPAVRERFSVGNLLRDIWSALQNNNFRTLFFVLLTFGVFTGLFTALTTHINTYFWELTTQQLFIQSMSSIIPTLLMILALAWLNARVEKQVALKLCIVLMVLNTLWFIPGRLLGWLPENHTTSLFVLVVLHGYINIAVLIWFGAVTASLIADITDEQELHSGKRQEGMFFAAQGFSIKFVTGIGTFAGGLVLSMTNMPAGAAPGTVEDSVLFNLGMVMGPGLAVFLAVPYFFASRLRVSRAQHASIRAELDARSALN